MFNAVYTCDHVCNMLKVVQLAEWTSLKQLPVFEMGPWLKQVCGYLPCAQILLIYLILNKNSRQILALMVLIKGNLASRNKLLEYAKII
jgi:hypothetical protein